ncbi:hypothetical protein [Massilia sp.]|uniref:hypothetical protein n=1 Tax=Massilia sp. TaxID=1882437 RepID=UPI0028B0F740|nr:hypothetical protein [Massilia sp.]
MQLASQEQQALVWQQARGEGTPHITSMTPYSFAAKMLSKTRGRTHPGELVVWWVASDYLLKHRRYQGNSWWHLSGAALTIWLSQNWTKEEVLSAAFYSRQERMNDDDI